MKTFCVLCQDRQWVSIVQPPNLNEFPVIITEAEAEVALYPFGEIPCPLCCKDFLLPLKEPRHES